MLRLKQQPADCLLTSLAMVMDVTLDQLQSARPKDFHDIWWENSVNGRRGVAYDEIVDYLFEHDFSLIKISTNPYQCPADIPQTHAKPIFTPTLAYDRLNRYLKRSTGILVGVSDGSIGHALANCRGDICDPTNPTVKYTLENPPPKFQASEYWLIQPINVEYYQY